MNDVLKMMSKTKMHHMEKLKVLQDHAQRNVEEEHEDEEQTDEDEEETDEDEEERRRVSDRLAGKPRRNFSRFHKHGFE